MSVVNLRTSLGLVQREVQDNRRLNHHSTSALGYFAHVTYAINVPFVAPLVSFPNCRGIYAIN